MPRSRKRHRKPSNHTAGTNWTGIAETELLAWAEHCRRRDASGKRFENTVVRHLQYCLGVKFSYYQVECKLKELARSSNAPLRSQHYFHMYQGHIQLVCCAKKDRPAQKELIERVKELDKNTSSKPRHMGHFLHNAARAQPHTNEKDFSKAQGSGRVTSTPNPSPTSRRKRGLNKQKFTNVLEVPQTPSSFDDNSLQAPNFAQSSSNTPSRSSRISRESSLTSIDPLVLDVQNYEEFVKGGNGAEKASHASGDTSQNLRGFSGSGEFESTSLQKVQDQMLSLHQENSYLRKELSATRDKFRDLEVQLISKQSTLEIVQQKDSRSIGTLLEWNEKELEILKARARDRGALSSFVKNIHKPQSVDILKSMKKHMGNLHISLDDLVDDLRGDNIHIQRLVGSTDSKLQALCSRILGSSIECDTLVSFNYLVRSLVSAAVCEWVFEREIQELCLFNSLLTETMLAQIATLDGDSAAQALHFSANKTVLESDFFQTEVIPFRGRILSLEMHKLLKEILPTWCPKSADVNYVRDLWEQERHRLENIFSEALKVKCLTLVGNNIFEVIFPEAGSLIKFDEVQVEKTTTQRLSQEEHCRVQLPLAPGLRCQGCDRKLVDYHSFRKPGDDLPGKYDSVCLPLILRVST